mmetsp:Transcript_6098/g.13303  ORF Transcript_6098/g.13303 Transcript_6098/m.13303 type:complete len:221 (-) Transcript_6098:1582-2244(-)
MLSVLLAQSNKMQSCFHPVAAGALGLRAHHCRPSSPNKMLLVVPVMQLGGISMTSIFLSCMAFIWHAHTQTAKEHSICFMARLFEHGGGLLVGQAWCQWLQPLPCQRQTFCARTGGQEAQRELQMLQLRIATRRDGAYRRLTASTLLMEPESAMMGIPMKNPTKKALHFMHTHRVELGLLKAVTTPQVDNTYACHVHQRQCSIQFKIVKMANLPHLALPY